MKKYAFSFAAIFAVLIFSCLFFSCDNQSQVYVSQSPQSSSSSAASSTETGESPLASPAPNAPDDSGGKTPSGGNPQIGVSIETSFGNYPAYMEFGHWPQKIVANGTYSQDETTGKVYVFRAENLADGTSKNEVKMFNEFLDRSKNVRFIEVKCYTYENKTLRDNDDKISIVSGNTYQFVVEPILWRKLGNSKMYISEKILYYCKFYDTGTMDFDDSGYGVGTKTNVKIHTVAPQVIRTIDGQNVYPNNYYYSELRSSLMGIKYPSTSKILSANDKYALEVTNVEAFNDKGFYQCAFTDEEKSRIALTQVNNTGDSTSDAKGTLSKANGSNKDSKDFTCPDTNDYVFVLSMQEASNSSYGFDSYETKGVLSTRARRVTDLVKGTGCSVSTDANYLNKAKWVLRSPSQGTLNTEWDYIRYVDIEGASRYFASCYDFYGVAPVITLK